MSYVLKGCYSLSRQGRCGLANGASDCLRTYNLRSYEKAGRSLALSSRAGQVATTSKVLSHVH
eukprot:scaffold312_cov409-Pavlova_lutheri.AAC.5